MKRLCVFFLVSAISISCTKSNVSGSAVAGETEGLPTRSDNGDYDLEFNLEDVDNTYHVTSSDIDDYLKYKQISSPEKISLKGVEPFYFQGAIIFYVINYESGWEIVSADKRTPVLLAKGKNGSFSMKGYESSPWGTWMFTVGLDVLNTRLHGLDVSYEENESLRFWTLITEPEVILGQPSMASSTPPPPPPPPPGHYELVSTYTIVDYDSVEIDHLTTTKWSQTGSDCNYYVPFRTDTTYLKAPAGCVAVAGAQMLYFLHNTLGVPAAAPSSAYCYGNVDSYQMGQSGSSTTVWSQMTTWGGPFAGILIANAGTLVGMDYGNDGSTAYTSDLVDNFFGYYGIDCIYGDYNTDAIRSQIIHRGIPIIVRAGSFVLFDTWHSAHSFIVDGARYSRNKTVFYYEWVYDVNPAPGTHLPSPLPPYTVESYSINTIEMIKMNWGWGGSYNEDWFSPGGDWELNTPEGLFNFQYRRKMISGFNAD